MAETLQAVLLSSTGLFFSCGTSSILVDVLNGAFRCFRAVDAGTARAVILGEPPYDQVDGIFYSHLHPDHYDQASNAAFLRRHPGISAFFPQADTPDHGVVHTGAFTVEYQYLEHVPCDYAWAKHYVFLISAGGTSVYLTTDAGLAVEGHRAFLGGRPVDYAFWNAIYLSYPQTRRLLREAAAKTYIYHMPEPAGDTSGICRKAARNFARYPEELAACTVLTQYPSALSLPPLTK
ncbi:MAG: hypothetical protein HFF17_07695 [Oscillospiraceae bacterium]|nr:hypothetical protein [Oscillospiraceae bacterium]